VLVQADRGQKLRPVSGGDGGVDLIGRILHKMRKNWRIVARDLDIVASGAPTSGSSAAEGLFGHDEMRAVVSLDRLMLPMSSAGTGSFTLNQLPDTAVQAVSSVSSDNLEAPAWGGRQQ
jgi:hypothetical protein